MILQCQGRLSTVLGCTTSVYQGTVELGVSLLSQCVLALPIHGTRDSAGRERARQSDTRERKIVMSV